ncbi:murein hydrolase activator EnvC family protein [Bradyrhizobium quebecense]|uniref:M23 family metallopeptidase n=2 Tax=Bradyrhizobium quebecense TaxID=2748629 RepID=A0ACD3V7X0_9BRAD|nr:M23 family metallopeptidase [Bradyrhizobium quebecense]UGY02529.1 M23 family metallopeptidase [Bradyrhizobium quebecense]
MAGIDDVIAITPTLKTSTLLRAGPGSFGASRGAGHSHQGVDIVANQSAADKSVYQVRATSDGTVAYCQINGSASTGYGYTVVVDHQNGFYTLYAHLAINASRGLVTLGQAVAQGDIIGYLADLANGEKSSGNVLADVVAPYDKIQLHIECFEAPQGRSSTGTLKDIKDGCTLDDPTLRLQALGYQSF